MQIDEKHHSFFLAASNIENSGLPVDLLKQSADVQHIVSDKFGIDEARNLTEQSSQKAVAKEYRSFVISASSITMQAQNALLKLFEEPPEKVRFYLLLPSIELLLPTLKSRLSILQSDEAISSNDEFGDFLRLSYADRIALIADKTKQKDFSWIDSIVSGALVHAESVGDKQVKESVVFVASHINGPGASKKMLLEELALSLK